MTLIERTRTATPGTAGAIAGAVSTVVFTAVHQATISNIWGMLPVMLVAGAVSGMTLAWTYTRLLQRCTAATWIGFNGLFLAMFAGLAAVSVVVFEPVTTMSAILEASGPVDDLIIRALPLSAVFVVGTTVVLGVVFARAWTDYLRLLLSVTVLMVFLGLNVSVLGLVEFAGAEVGPVVFFFVLIVLLDVVFATGFAVMYRPAGTEDESLPG